MKGLMKRETMLWIALIAACIWIAMPSQAYEKWWYIDGDGYWLYSMEDGSLAKDVWIHDKDDGEWYLLGKDGKMLTGIYESEGRYYLLDTVRGTGTYGKLLKEGDVYQGITIHADTNAAYEGALSQDTIAALQNAGVNFTGAVSISGTQQVENGQEKTNETSSALTGILDVILRKPSDKDQIGVRKITVSGNKLTIDGYISYRASLNDNNYHKLGLQTLELALTDNTSYYSLGMDEFGEDEKLYYTKTEWAKLVQNSSNYVGIGLQLTVQNGVVISAALMS